MIRQTLINMGYAEVSVTRAAAEMKKRLGKDSISKQRLAAIIKADSLAPETLEKVAKGLGISVAELMSGGPKKKS